MAIFFFFYHEHAHVHPRTYITVCLTLEKHCQNGDLPKDSKIKDKGDLLPSARQANIQLFPQTREEEI